LATLDDIAQELGISKATVSKALNGAKDVSKKTQQAVVEKAVELGYSRSNYSTASPRIAIFVINMDYLRPDDFGYDIIVGFRKAAEPAGFLVEVIPLTVQIQEEYRYDEYMMRENYVGALFLGMCLRDPWIQEFETCKSPTILYDNRVVCNPNVTSIGVDNEESIRLAINYLRSLGHSKIGYLGNALEAYVSVLASDYTDGLALQAIQMVFKYLPRAVKNGKNDLEAREKMHNASTMAGMAFANAFLGMNHSLAHKIGAVFHTPHGRANAILLPHVIRYNGTVPQKLSTWPKYEHYNADEKYQTVARLLGLKAKTVEEGVESLAKAVMDLGKEVGIKMNFCDQNIAEEDWNKKLKDIAFMAFEDQCSPANPRVPMVEDMIEILKKAYKGN